MKIVLCNGGLGNQTFQYIFSRYLELECGEPVYLNNAAFCSGSAEHNGFEIPKVFPNAKPRLLSKCFSQDVWEYMIQQCGQGTSIVQQLLDAGENIAMVAETSDYSFNGNVIQVPCNNFLPWLAWAKGNIYYHGYWINRDWLKSRHGAVLQQELQFAPLPGTGRNAVYAKEIEQTESVALHVRRGDFVKRGWNVSPETYFEAVEAMRVKVKNAHFFVFSDDIDWCRDNQEKLGFRQGEVTFVEGNAGGNSYIDMQLMSYCKNMILAQSSSFSYLATLLNRNAEVLVYNRTGRAV